MEPDKAPPLINKELYQKQVLITHKNYQIPFPYEPYEVQKKFMYTLIDTLDTNSNALLQSPTGTGKTLCLLTSVLTWLSKKKQKQPSSNIKIIYASRTHSQLRQVIKQLKNTCFRPKILTASSRDHSCINPDLEGYFGHYKEIECRKRIKQVSQSCDYSYIKRAVVKYSNGEMPIMDLKQIRELGLTQHFCPFLFARSQEYLQEVNLILMPYNYIMDRNVVGIYTKILSQSILIIDEAHNIQTVSMDGASMTLKMNMVELAHQQVAKVRQKARSTSSSSVSDMDFDFLIRFIINFQQGLVNEIDSLKKYNINQGRLFRGKQILNFFMRAIKYSENQKLFFNYLNTFVKLASVLMNQMNQEYLWQFDKLSGYIMLLHQILTSNNMLGYYRLCLRQNEEAEQFELWCIDPSIGFKKLKQLGVQNVILASGTLSPISSWQSQLKVKFKNKLTNNHVIQNSQVMLSIVQSGPNSNKFIFNYDNRSNEELNKDLCNAIYQLAEKIPHGMVVFFPSNVVMEFTIKAMRNYNIFNKLSNIKHFHFEPRGDANFQQMFQAFKNHARSQKGALMFAVCRSRVSEGIDLSDELCRAVIFVGVPYPPIKDMKIMEKKNYQDTISRQSDYNYDVQTIGRPIDGKQWYSQQTIRAVNQALGRAIRHKNDYGAIYLFDARYNSTSSLKRDLPKWAMNTMKVENDFKNLLQSTKQFFNKNKHLDNQTRPSVVRQQDLLQEPNPSKKRPVISLKTQKQKVRASTKKAPNVFYQPYRKSINNKQTVSPKGTLDSFFKKKQ